MLVFEDIFHKDNIVEIRNVENCQNNKDVEFKFFRIIKYIYWSLSLVTSLLFMLAKAINKASNDNMEEEEKCTNASYATHTTKVPKLISHYTNPTKQGKFFPLMHKRK